MTAKALKKSHDVIDYIAFMINEFALRYKLSMQQAFNYLKTYGGIAFLDEFYDIEHCENPKITLDSLQTICVGAGGRL